jgi:hypothetical protein
MPRRPIFPQVLKCGLSGDDSRTLVIVQDYFRKADNSGVDGRNRAIRRPSVSVRIAKALRNDHRLRVHTSGIARTAGSLGVELSSGIDQCNLQPVMCSYLQVRPGRKRPGISGLLDNYVIRIVILEVALYEQAGRTPDMAAKNRYIAFANNFVIYREQHEAVQPAFSPGTTLPGEVDRLQLAWLLQLRVFGFGLFVDGNLRVGVFPEG